MFVEEERTEKTTYFVIPHPNKGGEHNIFDTSFDALNPPTPWTGVLAYFGTGTCLSKNGKRAKREGAS